MALVSRSGMKMTTPLTARRSLLFAAATGGLLASYYFGGGYRGIANDAVRNKLPQRLTPVQVTSWLREHEESYYVDRGKGCVRYDVSQLASNSPIEDDRSERILNVKLATEDQDPGNAISTDWMFWGIYDGHSGWTTSAVLRESLINSVIGELGKVYERSSPNAETRIVPSDESKIDNALKKGFEELDDQIVNTSIEKLLNQNFSKSEAAQLLAPAMSGSCGLLAFYDSYSSKLRVAVAGDSRVVLGSKRNDSSGQWTATALSTDQTGSNQDEAMRIRSEHPGEESTAVFRGRVLGSLEPTRSFGDAKYKWSRKIQERISSKFFGRRTPSELRSPPYVTASPEVTTTKIFPGDFIVMGSDGLYEMLSNEEVVSLVAKWIDEKHPELQSGDKPGDNKGSWFGWGSQSKRKELAVEDISLNKDAQKQPIRKNSNSQLIPTVEDENVATHLIRNALGGADQQQVSMLVSIPSPISRSYRDDLTVTVVFFGDTSDPDDSGTVKVNSAATARLKSKL